MLAFLVDHSVQLHGVVLVRQVHDSSRDYELSIGGFDVEASSAGDSFLSANRPELHLDGAKFSTRDRDLDESVISCAAALKGSTQSQSSPSESHIRCKIFHCFFANFSGWWYRNCARSHLTGEYKGSERESCRYGGLFNDGVEWTSYRGAFYSYKVAEMKVRAGDHVTTTTTAPTTSAGVVPSNGTLHG